MNIASRRQFLKASAAASAALLAPGCGLFKTGPDSSQAGNRLRFGLVTYLWGRNWDVPTLIANCEKTDVLGVELRTTHNHGVERTLDTAEREEVRARFEDSKVTLVGLGSNERFCHLEPEKVSAAMQATREFIVLSHDVGGSGVKVKPNSFQDGVKHERTIDQIGTALNALGPFAADHGQELRLEVHGSCGKLPTIKAILDIASHPNVKLCWNSNQTDLVGEGLESNFNLVNGRFGHTAHVNELDTGKYPYDQLLELFVGMDYDGWLLLEAVTRPEGRTDLLGDLIAQREIFEELRAKAQAKL